MEVRTVVQVSKALAHPARLRILALLNRRTLCVCQMASVLQLAYPTISGHLTDLRQGGLVTEEKQGKWVFYSLDERSPFFHVVADLIALATDDEEMVHDREVVDRVQAVPVDVLSGAGCDIEKVGIQRPVAKASTRRRLPQARPWRA